MYVGGTEHNIKAAFAQAEAEHAILFLDEIDGLVQSRERANRSWEVTQVNELLYQMENFNGIMIGATNFVQNLDPAIMRRFTFKLGFDYLDNYGKLSFFSRMFHTRLTIAERRRLEAIENLTPGDFRTVRQSLYYLDEVSNAARLSALEQESRVKKSPAKQENRNGKIGF
jgi:SpoVK/Ycf46/Vps4 family AAA+-type ATPase